MSNRPIASHDTPDPWLLPSPVQPSLFYLTFTLGNRIEIWSSPSMEDFTDSNPQLRKSTIWQPAPNTPWSADIWAPELHYLFGTWWIYAAAAQPGLGNKSHRTVVLRCTNPTRDPMDRESWVFEGELRGVPRGQWGIDATVFSPDAGEGVPDERRRWYLCYSGWPLGDESDTQQDLFLARLKSPLEIEPGSLTCISRAELGWERPEGGRRGVNEGPTWVDCGRGNDRWRGIVYSAHGSWTCEYKLGLLRFVGGEGEELCDAKVWRKRPTPLMQSDRNMGGPFGPGHASFVRSPYADGGMFCVYHGTEREDEGWANRKGRVVCMGPDCFREDARTMCCAYSVCGPVRNNHGVMPGGIPGNQSQGVYPGQIHGMGQGHGHQGYGQPPQGQGSGNAGATNATFQKYAGEIEKRIPAQYQGYFNKAKKLFK